MPEPTDMNAEQMRAMAQRGADAAKISVAEWYARTFVKQVPWKRDENERAAFEALAQSGRFSEIEAARIAPPPVAAVPGVPTPECGHGETEEHPVEDAITWCPGPVVSEPDEIGPPITAGLYVGAEVMALPVVSGVEARCACGHSAEWHDRTSGCIECPCNWWRPVDSAGNAIHTAPVVSGEGGSPERTYEQALGLIAAERQRQVDAEGWTPKHDDSHRGDSLAIAAAAYATPAALRRNRMSWSPGQGWQDWRIPERWPWEQRSWKPTPDDRVRELVKAGALIVAEIERLQRAEVSR